MSEYTLNLATTLIGGAPRKIFERRCFLFASEIISLIRKLVRPFSNRFVADTEVLVSNLLKIELLLIVCVRSPNVEM